jgi:hypothetical protein
MHVCEATIQDCNFFFFKNPEKWQGFLAKLKFFVVPPKLDQINFFKNSKRTWLGKV